jgi:hypothetical protein
MNEHRTGTHAIDIASLGIVAGSLLDWLPAIASVLSILWMLIRIWETDTVRGWTNRRSVRPDQ